MVSTDAVACSKDRALESRPMTRNALIARMEANGCAGVRGRNTSAARGISSTRKLRGAMPTTMCGTSLIVKGRSMMSTGNPSRDHSA